MFCFSETYYCIINKYVLNELVNLGIKELKANKVME